MQPAKILLTSLILLTIHSHGFSSTPDVNEDEISLTIQTVPSDIAPYAMHVEDIQHNGYSFSRLEEIALEAGQGRSEAQVQVLDFFNDRLGKGLFWSIKKESFIVGKLKLQSWNLSHYNALLCSLFVYKSIGTADWIIPQEIINHIQEQAQQKESYALNNLGLMYQEGIHFTQDMHKAEYYLRTAADQNCAEAQFHLALLLRKPNERQGKVVIDLLSQAAHQNHAKAQYLLGNELITEPGQVPQAIPLIMASAKNGLTPAQMLLGQHFEEGKHIEKDQAKALHYYTLAAEQGFAPAQFRLACLLGKSEEIEQNHVLAAQWMRRAGDQKHIEAYRGLGRMYDVGRGVPKNELEAFQWYNLGAKSGDTNCYSELAAYYFQGKGTPANYDKNLKWILKGAEKQCMPAMLFFGCLFPLNLNASQKLPTYQDTLEKSKERISRLYKVHRSEAERTPLTRVKRRKGTKTAIDILLSCSSSFVFVLF